MKLLFIFIIIIIEILFINTNPNPNPNKINKVGINKIGNLLTQEKKDLLKNSKSVINDINNSKIKGSIRQIDNSVIVLEEITSKRFDSDASCVKTTCSKVPSCTHPCETSESYSGYIYVNKIDGKYKYTFEEEKKQGSNPVAYGSLEDSLYKTGWSVLNIETFKGFTDVEQSYAAGYIEGILTHHRISSQWDVFKSLYDNIDQLGEYLMKHDQYLREEISQKDTNDYNNVESKFWYGTALTISQLDGLVQGYMNARRDDENELSLSDFWVLNSEGDSFDIANILKIKGTGSLGYDQMSASELIQLITYAGRCSALIKWTGDDLFVGHDTFAPYAEMIRIYKKYNFKLSYKGIKSQKSSFSSYPGLLSSSDDFYILDSGLVLTETTINILDEKLYQECTPNTGVVAWIRTGIANRFAADALEWEKYFAFENSGTYNDQWMIIDYNKFTPGSKKLKENTLRVIEQIPTKVVGQDMTELLQKDTYWASYNRPYFPEIRKISMYDKFTTKHGKMFEYENCPRGQEFASVQKTITDLESMKIAMRHNEYKTDAEANGCPSDEIASRSDIKPGVGCRNNGVDPQGAIDTKITSSALSKDAKCNAIAGPTTTSNTPFSWAQFPEQNLHNEPQVFNFDWTIM